ncbi:hypothetical protein CYMTET_22320, partial [Cymbomonas tetramitiformis]
MPPKKKAFRLRRQRMQEYTNEVDSETGLSRAKLASLKAHAPKDVRDVADSLVNLSSDTLSRERRTAVFETEDKWRRVRRTLEGEDGNPIISAYRLEQLKKLEIQIKHNDPNGQKKLGQLSRLGDSLALATRDIAATRYSAKDKVRTAERRLEALNLDYQKLANNHKDLQAKFAKLESKKGLTAELKKVNAKLQRSHTAVQSLKGRLRHPESFLTSELVKNFIDRRLRPTAVKWILSVMVESSKLRKYGVSANVLPKIWQGVYRAIIGGDFPDSGRRKASWMSTSTIRTWSEVVAEMITTGIADLLSTSTCPIPDSWKALLGKTLPFSALFDTSVRFTKHLSPKRIAAMDWRPAHYGPVTPLFCVSAVTDTCGDTQADNVVDDFGR